MDTLTKPDIQRLLQAFFKDVDLVLFCYDYYPNTYRKLAQDKPQARRVQELIAEAEKLTGLDHLLKLTQATNEELYNDLLAKLDTLDPVFEPPPWTPDFAPKPGEDQNRHNELILLKRVYTYWIQAVLETSLLRSSFIDLQLEDRSEEISHPLDTILHPAEYANRIAPFSSREIGDVFQQTDNALLILGEAGSGKSTILLKLAQEAIAEAVQTPNAPLPVVFNLVTWSKKRLPLTAWLLSELRTFYDIPTKVAQVWLQTDRLFLLLDGLDEVADEYREPCIQAVNAFRNNEDHGLVPLIVCSRIEEYEALNTKLELSAAVVLQPLDDKQINRYLTQVGKGAHVIQDILSQDVTLQKLAQAPLILNVMVETYSGVSERNLETFETAEAYQKQLFDNYIERMFARKRDGQPYNDSKTKERLSWLARKLYQENQGILLLEGLQPSWLTTSRSIWGYIILSRLLVSLLIGLSIGLSGTLAAVTNNVWFGGLLAGLLGGVIICFIDLPRLLWHSKKTSIKKRRRGWQDGLNFMFVWLITGSLIGFLINGPSSGEGLSIGFTLGLALALVFGSRTRPYSLTEDIYIAGDFSWSLRKALIKGLIFGPGIGLILALTQGPINQIDWLIIGLLWSLIFGPIGGFVGGFSRQIADTPTSSTKIIQLATRNAILAGLAAGLIGGIITLPLEESVNIHLGSVSCPEENDDIICVSNRIRISANDKSIFSNILYHVFALGQLFGVLVALWYGARDIIQHYILRLLLFAQDHLPQTATHFLDHAVERLLLQKTGGGYQFRHRLLQEYFAALAD